MVGTVYSPCRLYGIPCDSTCAWEAGLIVTRKPILSGSSKKALAEEAVRVGVRARIRAQGALHASLALEFEGPPCLATTILQYRTLYEGLLLVTWGYHSV